jgi:hypothetical protein
LTQPLAPIVPPPAEAPVNGLLVSARKPVDAPGIRWQLGFSYEPEGCVDGTTFDPCDAAPAIVVPTNPSTVEWQPVALSASYRCSTWDYRAKDWQAVVLRRLEADQERQLGFELWTGTLAQAKGFPNKRLAGGAIVDILTESGPVGLVHGLACLEEYLNTRNGGQRGMIHATAQVASHWSSFGMLLRENDRLRTYQGTEVVTSPGYPGTNPNGGIADDDVWAYATDMVDVRLAEVQYIGLENGAQVNRETNEITVRAQRDAAASWQGCRLGGVRLAVIRCGIGGS